MKKLILLVTALAFFGTVALRAADDPKPAKPAKPAAKGKVSDEDLKKYDTNHDGKLDKDEKAAMRAAKSGSQKKKKDK